MLSRRQFFKQSPSLSALLPASAGLLSGNLLAHSLINPAPNLASDEIRPSSQQTSIGSWDQCIAVLEKLKKLQRYVGHGSFNVLSFDEAIQHGKNRSDLMFSHQELAFIEELFYSDAKGLGFYGEKVSLSLTARIPTQQIVKVPGTGHFLYKADALSLYEKIRKELGSKIVLTSGVRSNVKQLYLFLSQVVVEGGDFSAAAHKLAPPGYSYHGVGDFDVGKQGFGAGNFTSAFAKTDEYRRLAASGYVLIRYPHGNPFGVRFEPWHVKVVS